MKDRSKIVASKACYAWGLGRSHNQVLALQLGHEHGQGIKPEKDGAQIGVNNRMSRILNLESENGSRNRRQFESQRCVRRTIYVLVATSSAIAEKWPRCGCTCSVRRVISCYWKTKDDMGFGAFPKEENIRRNVSPHCASSSRQDDRHQHVLVILFHVGQPRRR